MKTITNNYHSTLLTVPIKQIWEKRRKIPSLFFKADIVAAFSSGETWSVGLAAPVDSLS